jgi:RNA polymerase sigma-70 factor, ECF subfamily
MNTSDKTREVMRLALEQREALWAFLMGLTKDPAKAEDLFQNTYLVLCEKASRYEPGSNFLAWARQIARYEYLASVDPKRRPEATVEAEVLEAALDVDLSGDEPYGARREALQRCLETLQSKSRSAIELRYGANLPCRTVARRLDLSDNALYALLSRVRRALFECVERRLVTE